MQEETAIVRTQSAKSLEKRRQIFDAIRYEGLTRKQIVRKLGVSRQTVDYHLKFRNPDSWEDWSELTQLQNDFADALTREKFHLDLIGRLSRRLLWKGELRLPSPVVRQKP